MPNEQGDFQPGFQVRGRGGELRDGPYVVTDLVQWTADISNAEENRMHVRIIVQRHEPESKFTYEHAPDRGMTLEIPFGKKMMRGTANIVGRVPALVIEADVEVA